MSDRPRRRASVALVLILVLALGGIALAGCTTSKPPSTPPGIVGTIQSIEQAGNDWSILVVGGKQAAGAVSDKAMCRITKDTTVVGADGKRIGPEQLAQGSTVAVWFTGAVAESYPVQGTASYVEVRAQQ